MGDWDVSLNTSITAFKLSASPDDELECMDRTIGLVLCYPTFDHVDVPEAMAYYSFISVYLFKIFFFYKLHKYMSQLWNELIILCKELYGWDLEIV